MRYATVRQNATAVFMTADLAELVEEGAKIALVGELAIGVPH